MEMGIKETRVLTQQEFIGKWSSAETGSVREPRRTALQSLVFMMMGLVTGLSLASPSDWLSWWHYSARMGSRVEDSGRLVGHGISF